MIILNQYTNKATLSGEEIVLTEREWSLLLYLGSNIGRIMPHNSILSDLWPEGNVTRSNLHTLVGRLRGKIGDEHVVLRRGIGYEGIRIRIVKKVDKEGDTPEGESASG